MSKCSHCGGLLNRDYDGYEKYFVCLTCSREYDLKGNVRRMSPKECEERFGIKYAHKVGRG